MNKKWDDKKKRVSIFHNQILMKPKTVIKNNFLHQQKVNDNILIVDHSINDSIERQSSSSFNNQNIKHSNKRKRIFSMNGHQKDRNMADRYPQQSVHSHSIQTIPRNITQPIFVSSPKIKYNFTENYNHKMNDNKFMNRQSYSYKPIINIIYEIPHQSQQSIMTNIPMKRQYEYRHIKQTPSTGLQSKNHKKDEIMNPLQFSKMIKEVRCKQKNKHRNVKRFSSNNTVNYPHSPFVTKFKDNYLNNA